MGVFPYNPNMFTETLLIHSLKKVPISTSIRAVLVWLDLMSTSSSEFDVTKVSAKDIKRHITHEMCKELQENPYIYFLSKIYSLYDKNAKGTNK